MTDRWVHTYSTKLNRSRICWLVEDLWELSKELPVEEMDPQDLPCFDLLMSKPTGKVWGSSERGRGYFFMGDFAEHMKRVMAADLSYPVLLNPRGQMMDGCHRLMRAVLEGKKVLVKRFVEWPPRGTKE